MIRVKWAQNGLNKCYTNTPPRKFQQLCLISDFFGYSMQKLKIYRNNVQQNT